jgi:hypothetical protein
MLHTYVKIFDVIVTGKKNLPTFTHLNTASLPLARGYKRETGPGGRALVFGPVESVGALPGDEVSVWVSSGRVRSGPLRSRRPLAPGLSRPVSSPLLGAEKWLCSCLTISRCAFIDRPACLPPDSMLLLSTTVVLPPSHE